METHVESIAMTTRNAYVNHLPRFNTSQGSPANYDMADENQCKNLSQEPNYVEIDEIDSRNKKGNQEDTVFGTAGSCAYRDLLCSRL